MFFLRQLEHVIGKLSGAFGWLAGWLCIAMIGVVFYDVIVRYVFQGGSIALQEMEWHLFAAVFLLGAAYTMREDANVRVDVFYARMHLRKKAMIDIFGTIFFVMPMCSLILYSSYDFVAYSYKIKEISGDPGGLPYRFAFNALLPLGYFLVLLQSLAVLSRNVRLLAGDTSQGFASKFPRHQEKL
jgi:TRAP-type mannitol/chloroaromatic compound transport system permease small subunit